jgi:hypothetical protein
VRKVLVHRPGLRLGLEDGHTRGSGVIEQVSAARKAVVELGQTPWRNDLDVGLQSVEGELETDLVVALASAAVGDGEAALLLGDRDLRTGNDGTGQRGTCASV